MAFSLKPTDPSVAIERNLNAKIAHRPKLVRRLSESDAALAAATNAAAAVADAADNDDGRARAKKRDCADDLKERQDALAKCDAEIAGLKVDLAIAVDLKTRRDTVTEIAKLQSDFELTMANLSAAFTKLEPVIKQIAAIVPEGQALSTYTVSSLAQIPEGLSLLTRLMNDHSAAVASGSAPATLRKPEAPTKPAPVAAPALTQVFSWHALTWLDQHNQQRTIAKWRDVELPPAAAAYALEVGLALLPTDPRCNGVRNQSPGHPEPGWLNDLDKKIGPNISRPADPIMASSPFQVIDRGEPKIVQMRVTR